MSKNKLYQKKHGLPGVCLSSGKDGASYESGNNVYFGYINEYFETISVPVTNLVRIAQTANGQYYTGIFMNTGADQQEYYGNEDVNHNIYKPITDFDINSRYPNSYGTDSTESSIYAKVDVADGQARNGYWNTDDETRWHVDDSLTHEQAGYSRYSISEMERNENYRIKPAIGSTNGGRYFSIIENDTHYIFSTLNDKDVQKYDTITETSGRLNTAPSLYELMENDSDENSKTTLVNFVKYNRYGQ